MTIPPPVLGWNTKQPISQMEPLYSPEIVNFFPDGGTVDLRNGYRQYATGVGSADVRDLYEFIDTVGSRYLIATGNDAKAYEITSGGAGTSISGAASPFPARNYFASFNNKVFIKSSNTSHDVYYWTGSGNIAAAAFTGPSGDDKALGCIATYKNRLYFAGNSASAWYGGVNLITGALTEFDFSPVFESGGKLVYISSFSPTAADTQQQYFLAISTGGDAVLYQGDYPGSTTWSIAARYYIGSPIGKFSFFKYHNDILVVTASGLVSMLAVVQGTVGDDRFLSNNIGSAYKSYMDAVLTAGTTDLVSGCYYPLGHYILISIYTAANTYVQLVMNTTNNAWTLFKGQNGVAFTVFNHRLYFGGDGGSGGQVFKADNGYFDDNESSVGNAKNRTIICRHAYSNFDSSYLTKQFTEARLNMYQSEGFALTADMDVDYANTAAAQVVTPDTADTTYKYYQKKIGLNGIGKAGSFRIDGTVTTKRMSLHATEVFWNEGDK